MSLHRARSILTLIAFISLPLSGWSKEVEVESPPFAETEPLELPPPQPRPRQKPSCEGQLSTRLSFYDPRMMDAGYDEPIDYLEIDLQRPNAKALKYLKKGGELSYLMGSDGKAYFVPKNLEKEDLPRDALWVIHTQNNAFFNQYIFVKKVGRVTYNAYKKSYALEPAFFTSENPTTSQVQYLENLFTHSGALTMGRTFGEGVEQDVFFDCMKILGEKKRGKGYVTDNLVVNNTLMLGNYLFKGISDPATLAKQGAAVIVTDFIGSNIHTVFNSWANILLYRFLPDPSKARSKEAADAAFTDASGHPPGRATKWWLSSTPYNFLARHPKATGAVRYVGRMGGRILSTLGQAYMNTHVIGAQAGGDPHLAAKINAFNWVWLVAASAKSDLLDRVILGRFPYTAYNLCLAKASETTTGKIQNTMVGGKFLRWVEGGFTGQARLWLRDQWLAHDVLGKISGFFVK